MDPITKEEYIAMLQVGQNYQGKIGGGGYADTVKIPIIRPNLEYPYNNIPLQGDSVFHIETVPVCFLPASSLEIPETNPATIDLNSITEQLRSLRDHVTATQRYERIDLMVDYYNRLEIEINDFRRQGTTRGRGFTRRAKKRVDDLLREAIRIMQSKSNEMTTLQAQRATTQDPLLIAQIEQRIDDLKNFDKELEAMFRELNILAESTQIYDIKDEDAGLDSIYITGSHEYDIKKDRVVIKSVKGDTSLLAHELKHAFQFEMSQLSMVVGKRTVNHFFYDKHDEVEAYQRGALFGGNVYTIGTLPPHYDPLSPGPIDAHNNTNTMLLLQSTDPQFVRSVLQDIANRGNLIFRINGVTYIPQQTPP
jgi:hypothetical protein